MQGGTAIFWKPPKANWKNMKRKRSISSSMPSVVRSLSDDSMSSCAWLSIGCAGTLWIPMAPNKAIWGFSDSTTPPPKSIPALWTQNGATNQSSMVSSDPFLKIHHSATGIPHKNGNHLLFFQPSRAIQASPSTVSGRDGADLPMDLMGKPAEKSTRLY